MRESHNVLLWKWTAHNADPGFPNTDKQKMHRVKWNGVTSTFFGLNYFSKLAYSNL